jgi:MYXO-CTERM domain-containing protein
VAGGKAQTTIQTTLVSGSDQVALSVAGLPAGVTAAFSSASVVAGTSATLTFTAGSAVKAGSYVLLVTGKGSTATHMASVSLTVAATPAAQSSTTGALGCSTSGQGGTAGGGTLLLGLGLALMARRRRFGRT